jgi:prophage DNA circulation protein
MAWEDNMLPASLDSVEFLYDEIQKHGGRRKEVHEFPGRDEPHVEDMGRMAHRWSVRAFLIGEDYAVTRDKLEKRLESGDKHVFVHPYQGSKIVELDGKFTLTERDDKGRYCEFEFTLVEAGRALPTQVRATPAKIAFVATEGMTNLSEKTKLSFVGAIGTVFNSLANGFGRGASALRKVNGKIAGSLNTVDNVTDAINEFESELLTLMNTPRAVMNAFVALFTSTKNLMKDFVPEPRDIDVEGFEPDVVAVTLVYLADLFAFESEADAIPTPTEQSDIEEEGHEVISDTTKAAALISATDTLASLELESANQAEEIQQSLVDKFEILLNVDFDDAVIENLMALKALAVEHFTNAIIQLPRLRKITPLATVAALPLAYELYGDAEMERDIVKRNRIRHPAFIPGGVEIEVLVSD